MKTKEIIKTASELAKPFRISKGKGFRLKDVDPGDTLEFTKEADKPRAKEALATGLVSRTSATSSNTWQGMAWWCGNSSFMFRKKSRSSDSSNGSMISRKIGSSRPMTPM